MLFSGVFSTLMVMASRVDTCGSNTIAYAEKRKSRKVPERQPNSQLYGRGWSRKMQIYRFHLLIIIAAVYLHESAACLPAPVITHMKNVN